MMGHKHSKHSQHQKRLRSQPEVTEIIDLNDTVVEEDVQEEAPDSCPVELQKIAAAVDLLERSVELMTDSQLDLYKATIKDDLHNNWQKLYEIPDNDDADVRTKKIEAIERVKEVLRRLNGKVLMNVRN